jgi:hypothetical protein
MDFKKSPELIVHALMERPDHPLLSLLLEKALEVDKADPSFRVDRELNKLGPQRLESLFSTLNTQMEHQEEYSLDTSTTRLKELFHKLNNAESFLENSDSGGPIKVNLDLLWRILSKPSQTTAHWSFNSLLIQETFRYFIKVSSGATGPGHVPNHELEYLRFGLRVLEQGCLEAKLKNSRRSEMILKLTRDTRPLLEGVLERQRTGLRDGKSLYVKENPFRVSSSSLPRLDSRLIGVSSARSLHHL